MHASGGSRSGYGGPVRQAPKIAILGAGAAGLCMAIHLLRAGIETFTIFEKSGGVGGTWRDNSYPGAGCDVPSHLYCFSFEPNPDWTRKYALQHEILRYLEHCASKYEVLPHVRFKTEIVQLRHLDQARVWELTTAAGERLRFDVVVTGTGQLNRPYVPNIEGIDRFGGETCHSARWRHEENLFDCDVAVVGNGASALQLIPQLARRARSVTLFQRSGHWVVPKPDRPYLQLERRLFRRIPWLAKLHRLGIYWALEARFLTLRQDSLVHRAALRIARRELDKVSDPTLRAKLTPDYVMGCKRILISSDYYEALQRPSVSVIDEPIERIVEEGVVTATGTHSVDHIVFATGFESTRFLAPIEIVGRDGRSLTEVWHGGALAYLGMAVAGFPNLFMLYGPNTNLGHNSILFMIECQTRYIVQCLAALKQSDRRQIEVSGAAMDRYNEELQASLGDTVWGTGCDSWYHHASGRVTNNWASFATAYWWRTRSVDLSAFVLAAE